MLARTARNCPGRMNIPPVQENSIIYVTYVRTKGHASHRYTLCHHTYLTKGRPLWRGHANERPRRRPAK